MERHVNSNCGACLSVKDILSFTIDDSVDIGYERTCLSSTFERKNGRSIKYVVGDELACVGAYTTKIIYIAVFICVRTTCKLTCELKYRITFLPFNNHVSDGTGVAGLDVQFTSKVSPTV